MNDEALFEDQPETTLTAATHFSLIPVGVLASGVSSRAIHMYAILRSYLRPGHSTFPHMDTVCETFNISRSTFQRGLAELKDSGLVEVTKREFARGFVRSNAYHFPDVSDDGTVTHSGGSDMTSPNDQIHHASDLTNGHVSDLTTGDWSNMTSPEEEKLEEEKLKERNSRVANATRQRRPVALPADFRLLDEMVTWAHKNTPLVDDLQGELGKFSDWHRAHGKKYVDWIAAWRNWMRNANGYMADRLTANPGRPEPETGMTKERVKAMFAEEGWEYGE